MTKLNFTYQGLGKQRLDGWLSRQVPDKSRAALQSLIRNGQVFVNEENISKPSQFLQSGDVVAIDFPPLPKLEPDDTVKFEVIAEEPNFLIIDKPAGLVVHPGSGNLDKTLVNGLIARYPEIVNVGEDPLRPGIVHRLDKDTSGVMVVARTQEEYDNLKKQFKGRETEKKYLAILKGSLEKEKGVIEGYMKRSENTPIKRELTDNEGKFSRTEYEVLLKIEGRTLVVAKPKTGRTHQLRVHFASLGHPIIGDTLYGDRMQTEALLLHAFSLRFRDKDGVWHEYEVKEPSRIQD